MIRLQGKYTLTFPVTPAEINFKGYGNDTESITTITLLTKNRMTGRRAKALAFDFFLPGDTESPIVEVEGYQGPRAWLNGLDLLSGSEVLVTIDELDLAWNVLIGPCDGKFVGMNSDFQGSIELPIFIKEEFVTWSTNKELLTPPQIIATTQKSRANTSGKKGKKQTLSISQTIQTIQRDRIQNKLTSYHTGHGSVPV